MSREAHVHTAQGKIGQSVAIGPHHFPADELTLGRALEGRREV